MANLITTRRRLSTIAESLITAGERVRNALVDGDVRELSDAVGDTIADLSYMDEELEAAEALLDKVCTARSRR